MFLICPPRWGLSRAARAHSPGSRFLAGPPVELWQGCGQSSAGWSWWQVLVASPAQRTGIGFPSSGSKLFSGNSLQNAKAAGRLGLCPWISVSPVRGEGMCKRGSFTVHGGWGSSAPHLPALALQVCLWAGRGASPWPSAPSGSTQPPPRQ